MVQFKLVGYCLIIIVQFVSSGDLPLQAADRSHPASECDCGAWEKIQQSIKSHSIQCNPNKLCTGLCCSGIRFGSHNYKLSIEVNPCSITPVSMLVNNELLSWKHSFTKNETVQVPELTHEHLKVFVEVNITKVDNHTIALDLCLLEEKRTPENVPTSHRALSIVSNQHMPLPACQSGVKSCRHRAVRDVPSDPPTPAVVARPCNMTAFHPCGPNEICYQTPESSGVCKCRSGFDRDADGNCIGILTSTVSPVTPKPSSGNGGAIGGSIVGVLLGVALILAVLWWCRRRRLTRLRIVRLYDDDEVLMRNDGYQPVAAQEENNQII